MSKLNNSLSENVKQSSYLQFYCTLENKHTFFIISQLRCKKINQNVDTKLDYAK